MHRVLPALALLALVGCATRGSVRQARADLATLRAEVATLRPIQEGAAHDAVRALGQLKSLDEPLREVRTRLEQTTAELERLGTRLQAVEDGIKDVRAELTKAPPPVVTPTPVTAPNPATEQPVREAGLRPGSAESAYGAALATFRAREHGQAVLEFLDFLATYPKHPLAGNAQYWIGEAYYVQRDYRQALAEFQKVLELPGRGANGKAADALLMMGLCHTNLHEPGRAQQTWERVMREHSDTEAAARARSLLRVPRAATRR